MKPTTLAAIALAFATFAGITGEASAQASPAQPIRIALPFAAGSPTDAMLRVIVAPPAKGAGIGPE